MFTLETFLAAAGLCVLLSLVATRKPATPPHLARIWVTLIFLIIGAFMAPLGGLIGQTLAIVATAPHYDAEIIDYGSDQYESLRTDVDGDSYTEDVTLNRAWIAYTDSFNETQVVGGSSLSSATPVIGREMRIAVKDGTVVELTYGKIWEVALLIWLFAFGVALPVMLTISGDGRNTNRILKAFSDSVAWVFAPGLLAVGVITCAVLCLNTWSDPRITGIGQFGEFFVLLLGATLALLLYLYLRFLLRASRKTAAQ